MSQPRRRATYDDLMQVPDHMVAEIIDGELITSPCPASPHAFAASALGQDLGPLSRRPGAPGGPGGWWILDEPELHFAEGRIDRTRKMAIYGREGIGNLWLVDPLARTLEVYRRGGERWVVAATHGGAESVRTEPFEALEIDIARWWLDEPAPGP